MPKELYDVIAVNIETHERRIMSTAPMSEKDAESFIKFAVFRRGVDTEFYKAELHNQSGEKADAKDKETA